MDRIPRVGAALLVTALAGAGCWTVLPTRGGGSESSHADPGERKVKPSDVELPDGYSIDAIAQGFDFPTGVVFDREGRLHVVESGYSYGEVFGEARLLRLNGAGTIEKVIATSQNGPWNGAVFHDGAFLVAEGGVRDGGRILRITPDGDVRAIVEGLPSLGDHHTNGPAVGPDGKIWFGQGTATNSAIVGDDNKDFGWRERHPEFHDIPCHDVTLTGENFETKDGKKTGAYLPFGTPSTKGQVIPGKVPCNGAVMRVAATGGPVELVAWGFRNPYGLAFAPDGTLFVADNGYDVRGSRPVFGAADLLWRVEEGGWHGWPDFADGREVFHDRYNPPGAVGGTPPRLLLEHPEKPPKPVAWFGVHSSSNGLDVSRSTAFGHVGQVFVAQFGDMTPETGKVSAPVGFQVVRVNPVNGVIEPFAVNEGWNDAPASARKRGGLERPVSVRFDPAGNALYVVDFGRMPIGKKGPEPQKGTGVIWRIQRTGFVGR
jgi:glucose/arabinose dehydrogenase